MNTLALTTGSELKDWVFVVGGNAFWIILLVRAIGYFFKEAWGKLITFTTAAVVMVGILYFPDAMKAVLSGVWGKVSGEA